MVGEHDQDSAYTGGVRWGALISVNSAESKYSYTSHVMDGYALAYTSPNSPSFNQFHEVTFCLLILFSVSEGFRARFVTNNDSESSDIRLETGAKISVYGPTVRYIKNSHERYYY
ncbi:hypothetical protein M378DRAFT_182175 [Amanita muscaria Koide BX008]|uniref:Uncharacterized protein n=1 Tax=Amanita muscaria (strain Koide BX008) TaxID=946122 RepID=A0A0C2WHR8_AMAMK|nr:hypothetical protein M378DRAFT_182175 [Amanita muscaria Koide BX008]